MVLFGKVMKPLEGRALVEEVGHPGQALLFYSLALLPVDIIYFLIVAVT